MLVRRIEANDEFEALTTLLNRAYAGLAAQGFRYKASYQDSAETRRRSEGGECYVATLEGRIVGTILVVGPGCPAPWSEWYHQRHVGMLGQFGVEPELQGRGIGSRLLDFGEQRVFELGAEEVSVDTAIAATHLVSLYRNRGYREVLSTQWQHANYRSVIMSKRRPDLTGPR